MPAIFTQCDRNKRRMPQGSLRARLPYKSTSSTVRRTHHADLQMCSKGTRPRAPSYQRSGRACINTTKANWRIWPSANTCATALDPCQWASMVRLTDRYCSYALGVSRAELEARKIVIPLIRKEKVGLWWVYANLFREETFERNGTIVTESRYAELRTAKTRFPIPVHAFYQPKNVSDHR